jgi:hypothetical protein
MTHRMRGDITLPITSGDEVMVLWTISCCCAQNRSQRGAVCRRLRAWACSVFQLTTYPYFLNHLATFEYKSKIAGALIMCSLGGIGAANGGIPSNFRIISTGVFPESLIRIVDM